MALLQPTNIPSRNDVSQRLQAVAKCLREFLPDEVTVWLERTRDGERRALQREFEQQTLEGPPDPEDSEPYLVVLDPEAGIVILEVPARIRVRRKLRRTSSIDRDRIKRLTAERVSKLRERLHARRIGDLPVKIAVALPDMSAADRDAMGADVPVLCADDFTGEALGPALQQIIGGHRRPVGAAEESAARAAVKPEIVIRGMQGQLFGRIHDSKDDEEILRTLDREQEHLAMHLGTGYRLIRGVAGSGKTLVLTCRALHMAGHFPHWRILLLCFNKVLSLGLQQQVKEHRNVEVRTLDALARQVLVMAGRNVDGEKSPDFDQRRRDALDLATETDESQMYDMVLVDEAQDLNETGLDLAWGMLKPGRDHFVMALDSAQRIYQRRMTWNPPGRTARGRTRILDVNYRNTREVLDLGQRLLVGLDSNDADPHPDDLDVLVRPEKALRVGLPPITLACADLRGEARAIAERVRELRNGRGARPDQIIVLLGTEELRGDVMRLVPDAFDINSQSRNRFFTVSGKVRVATLGLLKGLEFRHVIVGGANHVWVRDADRESLKEAQRRLLYVAVTRATETLTITCSGAGIMSGLSDMPLSDAPPGAGARRGSAVD